MEIEGFVDVSKVLRSGVYLLAHRGVVIYIGQSRVMLGRLATHRSQWGRKARGMASPDWLPVRGILFDEVHICPCPLEKLDELEREFIALYKPRFNTKLKSPGQADAPATLKVRGLTLAHPQTFVHPRPQIERRI